MNLLKSTLVFILLALGLNAVAAAVSPTIKGAIKTQTTKVGSNIDG